MSREKYKIPYNGTHINKKKKRKKERKNSILTVISMICVRIVLRFMFLLNDATLLLLATTNMIE